MASYSMIQDNAPYYRIEVASGERKFIQTVITDKTGAALNAHLQWYSDIYVSSLTEEV